MNKNIDLYSRVGTNCPTFYPNFSSGRTCPDISRATCRNCRNFSLSQKRCSIDMFDKVVDDLFDRHEGFKEF